MEKIVVPRPLQIVVDDLGWFCPTDDRKNGGPSRTAMSRYHVAADYGAINYLGEQLGMKINCAFVLGEWDPDNRLRTVRHLSKYGDGWDNAAHLDKEELRRCIEVINASPYIDLAVHGLLHGYYTEGIDNHDTSDYYYSINKNLIMTPESEIRTRLNCYFDILNYYNIKKEVNSFVPPSFATRWGELSRIVADFGILYSSTIFKTMVVDGEKPMIADVENGIITVDRNNNLIPWNKIAADFSRLEPTVGIFGSHWPNFLHDDPSKNHEVIDGAVAYFKSCAKNFGTVLSRDMSFAATQSLFARFAKIEKQNSGFLLNLSAVPKAKGRKESFIISLREEVRGVTGGDISLHSDMGGFKNYEIKPFLEKIEIKI